MNWFWGFQTIICNRQSERERNDAFLLGPCVTHPLTGALCVWNAHKGPIQLPTSLLPSLPPIFPSSLLASASSFWEWSGPPGREGGGVRCVLLYVRTLFSPLTLYAVNKTTVHSVSFLLSRPPEDWQQSGEHVRLRELGNRAVALSNMYTVNKEIIQIWPM